MQVIYSSLCSGQTAVLQGKSVSQSVSQASEAGRLDEGMMTDLSAAPIIIIQRPCGDIRRLTTNLKRID